MSSFPYTSLHSNDMVQIVVLHRRYADPSKGILGSTPPEVQAWVEENQEGWVVIPLWLYDHSGTVYRVGYENPFHCPWDSGQVGIVALRRAAWDPADDMSLEAFFELAVEIAEDYTEWANSDEDEL